LRSISELRRRCLVDESSLDRYRAGRPHRGDRRHCDGFSRWRHDHRQGLDESVIRLPTPKRCVAGVGGPASVPVDTIEALRHWGRPYLGTTRSSTNAVAAHSFLLSRRQPLAPKLSAMRSPAAGVMVARGDLAIECGYERLAEIEEEILWIAEASHMPVIWATAVMDTLAGHEAETLYESLNPGGLG
jgi:hypothetical protein